MSKSILDLIGNTPLVEAKVLNPNPNVKVLFKLEGNNPGGSVKDRPAYNMIKSGLERGDFTKASKLIEATSGNTGIGLAMIASLFGLDIELVMPENSTKERVQTMRAYGAKVTLRGERMYEFLDRLITSALPRVRDFQGVKATGFDGRGNYNLGVTEQIIFPEINIDRINRINGMDITFVTSAETDKEAKSLLTELGIPFKKN